MRQSTAWNPESKVNSKNRKNVNSKKILSKSKQFTQLTFPATDTEVQSRYSQTSPNSHEIFESNREIFQTKNTIGFLTILVNYPRKIL